MALRRHDETGNSDNIGIFRRLVDCVASLEWALKESYTERATWLYVVCYKRRNIQRSPDK